MRNVILIYLIAFCNFCAAQEGLKANRTITVTGSASMEILPDSICIRIQISDYVKDDKFIKKEETEILFLKFYKNLNIANKLLLVSPTNNANGVMGSLKISKKQTSNGYTSTDVYYNVWFKNDRELEKVVTKLNEFDNEGVDYSISDIHFSKLKTHGEELKLKTIQNAKEKATNLAASINEQIGNALQIGEVVEHYNGVKIQLKGNDHIDDIFVALSNYHRMKLYFEVPVIFALK